MAGILVSFVLLLLTLVDFYYHADTWSVEFNGPVWGIIVFAILLIAMLRRTQKAVLDMSERTGLPRRLPKTKYDVLPWLFAIPWLVGLRFCDATMGVDEKFHFTWEFKWGQSALKLVIMLALLLALRIYKLNKRIQEIKAHAGPPA